MSMPEEIVLVHGLWFGAWTMRPLARQLHDAGYTVRRFNYRTTRGGLAAHARRLRAFAARSACRRQHFIAHSLGGLVTLQMLSDFKDLPPGRVVFLASPVGGSAVARKAGRVPGSKKMLGEVRSALETGFRVESITREAGMIAGSKSLGLGMLVGGSGGPGDGTVSISETRVDGLVDHIVLPLSHSSILLSAEVGRQTAHFLETGGFIHANA